MIYLLLSIVFIAGTGISLRAGAEAGAESLGMNAIFRVSAGVPCAVALLLMAEPDQWGALWSAAGWMALVGAVFFFISGYSTLRMVQLGHLGLSYTLLRCSMVLPTAASILYWHEVPLSPVTRLLLLRGAGVVFTVAAIVCIGIDRNRQQAREPEAARGNHRLWLLWSCSAFVAQGCWEIMLRATRGFPDDQTRAFFTAMVFFLTALMSLPMLATKSARVGRTELGWGIVAGVCSLLGTGLRPWALRQIDGVIVFPATTVTVTLLLLGVGAWWWRERLGRLGVAGVVAAIVGILMLALPA